jgi:hypothetical protein
LKLSFKKFLEQDDLFESFDLSDEIKKIVKTGLSFGLDKISRDLHDFATSKIHSLDRASKEFVLMSKIISNPDKIAQQLMSNALNEIPTLH